MKRLISNSRMAVLALAVALLALLPVQSFAQTVTAQPNFAAPRTVVDLGNGPTEIIAITGNGAIFTALGSGVGSTSGSSTTLTLTGTPTIPPCVGCLISGTGITSGTSVAAYNGTTTITLSAAMTVAASTPLAWGAACPVSTQTNPVPPTAYGMALVQVGQPAINGLPFYTQGRICVYGATGPGLQFMNFAIGAH